HAYPADDGSGDVYFDVRSWAADGELTRQQGDDHEPAEDADPRGKRDPRDFALWKGWKKALEPETAAWPSPYGPGRPGWHIECSAKAAQYLGPAVVLAVGGAVPRSAVRHPRRRRLPALPPPRERAGSVACGRPGVRVVLAPQRL